MSVILTLPKIDIPTTLGWVHEASSWFIATEPSISASSIVVSSIEDTNNLTSITLDIDLQPDVVYYSKVRIFCNKGIIESDLDITEVKDSIKITNTVSIPSIVNKPTLTLDHDKKDLPASLFNVHTTDISTSSNGIHDDSSYIIETLDGESVYSKINSKDNLTEKSFDDVILDDGKPYILRVLHNSSSNDTSPFAEEVIVVKDTSEIKISSQLLNVDITSGLNVSLKPINDFKKMDVKLYATGMDINEKLVYESSITSLTNVIPASYFTSDNTDKYILEITVTRNDNTTIGPKFSKITTRFSDIIYKPTVNLFVSTTGLDTNTGTKAEPFKTTEKALLEARNFKNNTVYIWLRGGVYETINTINITADDDRTETTPLFITRWGDEKVTILGGKIINGWTPVTDTDILNKLPASTRDKILCLDLNRYNVTEYGNPDYGSVKLLYKTKTMEYSRWPKTGYTLIGDIVEPNPDSTTTSSVGKFHYSDSKIDSFINEPNVWVDGFWRWDWSQDLRIVTDIDTSNKIITLGKPDHHYGYKKGQHYYFYNILSELTEPGNWYLDRNSGMIYFYPPDTIGDSETAIVTIKNLLNITNANYIFYKNITFSGSRYDNITIKNGGNNILDNVIIKNVNRNGINIDNSNKSKVINSNIYDIGEKCITITGGDLPTLTPCNVRISNNKLHHFSKIKKTYTPAVYFNAVGLIVDNNEIYEAPHSGILFIGNNNIIESNNIHDVVKETSDAGAIYCGRRWEGYGNIIRYNNIKNIHTGDYSNHSNAVGVYLDDTYAGVTIYRNLFENVEMGIMLGGGRDNIITYNTFKECNVSLSLDSRGLGWLGERQDMVDYLNKTLTDVPYKSDLWLKAYPEMTNVDNINKMEPTGNVIKHNTFYEPSIIHFDSNTRTPPFFDLTDNIHIQPQILDLPNLIKNSNFNKLTEWEEFTTTDTLYDETVSRINDNNGSVKLSINDIEGDRIVQHFIEVKPNTYYYLNLYLLSKVLPSSNALVRINFYDINKDFISSSINSVRWGNSKLNTWELVEVLFNTITDVSYITVVVENKDFITNASNTIWADDFFMHESDTYKQNNDIKSKIGFTGSQTRIDTDGNINILKNGVWTPFFPFAIYSDPYRDVNIYSQQGFNCIMDAGSIFSDMTGSELITETVKQITDAKNAVSTFNPTGMMSNIRLKHYLNKDDRDWVYAGNYFNNTEHLESLMFEVNKLKDSVLFYNWDNENYWNDWDTPVNVVNSFKSYNNNTLPLYMLSSEIGIIKKYNDLIDYSGTYLIRSIEDKNSTEDNTCFKTLTRDTNLKVPVGIAQINIGTTTDNGVGDRMRPYVYKALIQGAKGISYWGDFSATNPINATYNKYPHADITAQIWWDDIVNLRTEIDIMFNNGLLNETVINEWNATPDNSDIIIGTRLHGGLPHLILTNMNINEVTTKVSLTSLVLNNKKAYDYFTDIVIDDIMLDEFNVTIGGYGSKVIIIK